MRKFFLTMMMLSIFAAFTIAQSTAGRLLGNVSGPDGLLQGATVTATDNQTGRIFTTTTSANGSYKFEALDYGAYTLKVTLAGFKAYVANDLKIDANREYSLNPKLELGDITAEVTVQAGAEIINSTTGELSTTVSPRQVIDLPINGRNPLALLNLQAGANPTANNHINGQRTSSTNFTRDGINVQDNYIRSGAFVQDRPTVDDTGEFTVITQNAGAELGNGGSAQISLVTPRGGSEFHGSAFVYNRNSAFAANEFGNNASGRDADGNENVPRPFLNRNQFGGTVSGPLPMPGFGEGSPAFFKDKGFFFVSYERFTLNQTSSGTTRVLLNQFRDGTFNYTDPDGVARSVNVLTGTGFDLTTPGNAALFADAQGVLALDPTINSRILSNSPLTGNSTFQNGGLTQNLLRNVADNTTRNTFTSRIDADINDNHSIYGTFRYVSNVDNRPDEEAGFTEPFVNITSRTRFFVAAWRSIWGNSFTNEFRASYADNNPFFAESPDFPTDYVIAGLPFGITDPLPSYQDQGRTPKQYTIQNNASYSSGNHTFRFGAEFVAHNIAAETNFNRVPIFRISNTQNANTPQLESELFPGGIGRVDLGRANSLRYFLGGIIGGGTVAANFQGPSLGPVLGSSRVEKFKYQTWALDIGDQWRVKPNLSVNLGLRWDYFTPLENPNQVYLEPDLEGAVDFDTIRTNLLDPTGQYVILGTNSGTPGRFFNPDLNNFAPNVSAAWSPNAETGPLAWLFGNEGKSTIRGGFRIGYINDEYIRASDTAGGANLGLDLTGRALQAGSNMINARFDNLPSFTLSEFQPPPISFATANQNSRNFFQTVWGIDPNLQMQTNYQYNIGFQREIGGNTAIEIRYVGGFSNNLARAFDFNQVQINNNNFLGDFLTARNNCRVASAAAGRLLDQVSCSSDDLRGIAGLPGQVMLDPATSAIAERTVAANIRNQIAEGAVGQAALLYIIEGREGLRGTNFRANTNAGPVDYLTNAGKYRYNSLQAEIRRRFTNGLQFQANYTFGKTLADALADGQSRFEPFLDFNNQGLEYSRADYDRTHTFNINGIYELPFGKGKRFLNQGGLIDNIFGGFQLTTIINISSGAPISIKDRTGTLNRGFRSGRQTANSSLSSAEIKDLVGVFNENGTIYYINPSVIAPDGTATNGNLEATPDARFPEQVFFRVQPGQTGTIQRALFNGPWYTNVDVGVLKNIRLGEKFKVQLRAEAFNVMNKTNFFIAENTNTFDIDSTTFGQIQPGSTFAPRIMQFAFRLEF